MSHVSALVSQSVYTCMIQSIAIMLVHLILTRLLLHTRLASPIAVCIAIRGRYTQLTWLANPNLALTLTITLTLLTLATTSRVSIRLAVCIETFFSQLR